MITRSAELDHLHYSPGWVYFSG